MTILKTSKGKMNVVIDSSRVVTIRKGQATRSHEGSFGDSGNALFPDLRSKNMMFSCLKINQIIYCDLYAFLHVSINSTTKSILKLSQSRT